LQKEVADLVFTRKLDVRKLITHTFELAQTAEAVALAAQATPGALKIIVSPEKNEFHKRL
jgi:threonine dehydrogenase-like Zn-dependent dehydrogenase